MRERTRLDQSITAFKATETDFRDTYEIIELGEVDGDEDIVTEALAALESLRDQVNKQQLESMLSGEADGNSCYLEVHAGAGGTEIPGLGGNAAPDV